MDKKILHRKGGKVQSTNLHMIACIQKQGQCKNKITRFHVPYPEFACSFTCEPIVLMSMEDL